VGNFKSFKITLHEEGIYSWYNFVNFIKEYDLDIEYCLSIDKYFACEGILHHVSPWLLPT
jgi:hypothetical protein